MPDLGPRDTSQDREEKQECVICGVRHDQKHDYPVEQIVLDPEEDSLYQPKDRVFVKSTATL